MRPVIDQSFIFSPVVGINHPETTKIGDDAANNIAITGFSTERNPENGKLQAFARIENYGPKGKRIVPGSEKPQ